MNYIEQMVAELCPNGVEFFYVSDIASVGTGSSDRKDATDEGEFPFYVRSKEVLRIDEYEFDEEAIIIPGEGGIGEIFHYASGRYALHQRAYRISFNRPELDTKFAYYYFMVAFKEFILSKAVSATVTSIRKPMITEFRIPIPPLPIQQEIVRVLDTFSQLVKELQANLQAELVARRKQYQYYRDQLLSFEGRKDVRWGTLGEMFDMRAGHHISAQNIIAEPDQSHLYPCFGGNGVRGFVEKFSHDGAYLLIGRQGALCGNVQRARGKFYATEHAVVVTSSAEINVDWAFHMLTLMNLNQYASKSAQPGLAVGKLAELRIAVPPLAEQEEIAGILDKFDALVNDLCIGLPAEIAARQKQYEYYRDRLLTFPEAAPQKVAEGL